ncbi:SDR family oxidoreductase [Sphingomonas abaci]|uniref:NAD(P)-dependent dehydrogenase (Short-subunit alcohol dehydrogenase family) n=1 Tax=Sphingomonas abaci TaxID=237611 RepID=A0A7W7AHA7_9SPHN|nr:SDR family oxidoreductase [Sphingomonas abaci]MBB4616305.1 NAD(P)-dependent dehydrogenase (short-subunit alcohol dehydrogenase family) [Sphingomonas abaci]
MARFTNKVVLITGAARGIGRAAATAFAREGAIVHATDIDVTELATMRADLAAEGLAVATHRQDVGVEAEWNAIFAAIGRIDVLVNNAGWGFLKTIEDTSLDEWRRLMAINVESVFLGMKVAIPAMRESGGVIVNVASIAANVAEPMFPAYNATKGAVSMLTKAAAVDCARKRWPVRINSLHPGYCDTKLVRDAIGALGDGAGDFASAVAAAIPLGRLAEPHEIAAPLLFLASEDAAYMIGAELVVDGGYIAV